MKKFYGDVTVIEKRRIRVAFEDAKKPTKNRMLKLLVEGAFEDIVDEECLEYVEVLKMDVNEVFDDDAQEDEEPETGDEE